MSKNGSLLSVSLTFFSEKKSAEVFLATQDIEFIFSVDSLVINQQMLVYANFCLFLIG